MCPITDERTQPACKQNKKKTLILLFLPTQPNHRKLISFASHCLRERSSLFLFKLHLYFASSYQPSTQAHHYPAPSLGTGAVGRIMNWVDCVRFTAPLTTGCVSLHIKAITTNYLHRPGYLLPELGAKPRMSRKWKVIAIAARIAFRFHFRTHCPNNILQRMEAKFCHPIHSNALLTHTGWCKKALSIYLNEDSQLKKQQYRWLVHNKPVTVHHGQKITATGGTRNLGRWCYLELSHYCV